MNSFVSRGGDEEIKRSHFEHTEFEILKTSIVEYLTVSRNSVVKL